MTCSVPKGYKLLAAHKLLTWHTRLTSLVALINNVPEASLSQTIHLDTQNLYLLLLPANNPNDDAVLSMFMNPCDDLDLYRSFNAVRTPGEATTNTPVTNHLHNSQPSPTTTPVPPRGGVTDAPASTMVNMAVTAPLSSAESTNVPVSNLFYHSQPPPVATPVLPPGIAETIANTANSPVPMPAPATEATKNRREVTRKRNRCKDNGSSSTQWVFLTLLAYE
ncbi:hypothetical protein PQX77_017712 [Marasmius sp. AFHP31]|nr:hypothetical protein PQX77_017712 [Marasmius sp. AFHP31]